MELATRGAGWGCTLSRAVSARARSAGLRLRRRSPRGQRTWSWRPPRLASIQLCKRRQGRDAERAPSKRFGFARFDRSKRDAQLVDEPFAPICRFHRLREPPSLVEMSFRIPAAPAGQPRQGRSPWHRIELHGMFPEGRIQFSRLGLSNAWANSIGRPMTRAVRKPRRQSNCQDCSLRRAQLLRPRRY
jgi:hypothetical protein